MAWQLSCNFPSSFTSYYCCLALFYI